MREGRKKKVKCATGVRDGRKKAKSGQDRAGLKELFENSSEENEFSGFSKEEVEKVMVSLYSYNKLLLTCYVCRRILMCVVVYLVWGGKYGRHYLEMKTSMKKLKNSQDLPIMKCKVQCTMY